MKTLTFTNGSSQKVEVTVSGGTMVFTATILAHEAKDIPTTCPTIGQIKVEFSETGKTVVCAIPGLVNQCTDWAIQGNVLIPAS